LLLIATTGSIFAAVHAGIMPASSPTAILILRPSIMMPGESITLKGKAELNAILIRKTSNKPMKAAKDAKHGRLEQKFG
jgi:hypothetical protein